MGERGRIAGRSRGASRHGHPPQVTPGPVGRTYRDDMNAVCPTCRGVGQVALEHLAYNMADLHVGTAGVQRDCPTCEGSGWRPYRGPTI